MSKYGSVKKNGKNENRFLYAHKIKGNMYDENGYYSDRSSCIESDIDASINADLDEKSLYVFDSLSSDYEDAFDDIFENKKYKYVNMTPSEKAFNVIRNILKKNQESSYIDEIENDEYASKIFEERLRNSLKYYEQDKYIELFLEEQLVKENNEEVGYIKGFDVYFFVKRKEITKYIRDFKIDDKKCKVVDYREIKNIEKIMLTKQEYEESNANFDKDIVPVSLINYNIGGDGCRLVNQFLRKHYNGHYMYLYSCIKHQDLSYEDYGLLVCSPIIKQVYAYDFVNSKNGDYVSIFDICQSAKKNELKYYIPVEFYGNEVEEYLENEEFKKVKFINYNLYLDDMKKSLALYVASTNDECKEILLSPVAEIKDSYKNTETISNSVDIYYLCGTRFGMCAITIQPGTLCKIEDIDDYFLDCENKKFIDKSICRFFENTADIYVKVIGNIVRANLLDKYNNDGNIEKKYNNAEYFSFYAESIIYKINEELRAKLIEVSNDKYDSNFVKTTKDLDIIKKQYAIASMLHDKNNYEYEIDIEKFNRVSNEIGETISENAFKENMAIFNENYDNNFKIKNISLSRILSTVMTAQALISFLSLYIAVVSVSLPNNTVGYIVVVLIIQIICLIIAGIVNNRMNN